MSWLNFNDSLTNLRGQLSNLASGVLSEGLVGETDGDKGDTRVEDLEKIIGAQTNEIEELRKHNAALLDQIEAKGSKNECNTIGASPNEWSWEPTEAKHTTQDNEGHLKVIRDLKNQIKALEDEKKDLVVSLEQLDLDCQQTTEKVINLKDALQTDYNNLRTEHDVLKSHHDNLIKSHDESRKTIHNLELKIDELQKLSISSKGDDFPISDQHLKELEDRNCNLQQQLKDIETKYEKLRHDIQTTEVENKKKITEISNILNVSTSEKDVVAKELEALRRKNHENEEKIASYQNNRIQDQEEYNKLSKILQSYEDQLKDYKEKYQKLETQNKHIIPNPVHTEEGDAQDSVVIITDTFRKFMDYSLPMEDDSKNSFSSTVETVMKHMLDLKWKSETLQKEVDSLTDEKTKILTEKKHEIEKLLENSEMLSQEVMTKNEALRHYEEERHELMKNSDLLINELESYRNNSGLQTISETNEDNVLLLESQLESANKRIKDLELLVEDSQANTAAHSELNYVKEQLNIARKEVNKTKAEYEELLKLYNSKELEHNNLMHAYDDVTNSYNQCYSENENLNETVDKIQTEYENSEYKYSEINISMETLKEESETLKDQIDSLAKSNKKLEQLYDNSEGEKEVIQNEIDDLKQRLTVELETRDQQETEIRNLKEKLQNVKMSETTLRLQNDKDLQTMLESKKALNLKLEETCTLYKETLERLDMITKENIELKDKYKELWEENVILKKTEEDARAKNEEISFLKSAILELKQENEKIKTDVPNIEDNKEQLLKSQEEIANLQTKLILIEKSSQQINQEKENLASQLDLTNQSLHQNVEKIKSMEAYIMEKHEENNRYYNEIQRLNQVLSVEAEKSRRYEEEFSKATSLDNTSQITELNNKIKNLQEENEKLTDQNAFLKEKCERLAQNLLEEQAKLHQILAERNNVTSEKEASLTKELQRLREHLLEIEDMHTEEMMLADARSTDLQSKLMEIEHREKEVTSLHTSVNIRTNQHVETLQNQLQMVTNQRDELRKKMSDSEDLINKQAAGLSNLEFVLRQFQEEKDKTIQIETERIRRQILTEKQIQDELRKELANMKLQLEESKQGLLAASRLSSQVEASKVQVASLKEEVQRLHEKLQKSEEKYNTTIHQVDSKVDKMLIKNLVVGFIGSNHINLNKDQHQVLKIIATVLDFSQQDNEKVQLNKPQQGSWLGSILNPNILSQSSNMSQESLSQAFVRFLENESKPRLLPNLLTAPSTSESTTNPAGSQQPVLLSEVVLPTFADFGPNRSSSILKDVLKDNN